MAVESWSETTSKPVEGESGDLVCIKPFPCMPVFFWHDEDKSKYRDAYFSHHQGKVNHSWSSWMIYI
jgi:acetoacetyl-CoA synthetase